MEHSKQVRALADSLKEFYQETSGRKLKHSVALFWANKMSVHIAPSAIQTSDSFLRISSQVNCPPLVLPPEPNRNDEESLTAFRKEAGDIIKKSLFDIGFDPYGTGSTFWSYATPTLSNGVFVTFCDESGHGIQPDGYFENIYYNFFVKKDGDFFLFGTREETIDVRVLNSTYLDLGLGVDAESHGLREGFFEALAEKGVKFEVGEFPEDIAGTLWGKEKITPKDMAKMLS